MNSKKEEIYADLKEIFGSWMDVKKAALRTIQKNCATKEPSTKWKKNILLSEHSPIRQMNFQIVWYNIKYWVSVHLVRHKIGIEHFVRSQRADIADTERDSKRQDSTIEHEILINAQAMINISRKRLCHKASKETTEAWKKAIESIREECPELYEVCVPECIYRGWCYEMKTCGFFKTEKYKIKLQKYRKDINDINDDDDEKNK